MEHQIKALKKIRLLKRGMIVTGSRSVLVEWQPDGWIDVTQLSPEEAEEERSRLTGNSNYQPVELA